MSKFPISESPISESPESLITNLPASSSVEEVKREIHLPKNREISLEFYPDENFYYKTHHLCKLIAVREEDNLGNKLFRQFLHVMVLYCNLEGGFRNQITRLNRTINSTIQGQTKSRRENIFDSDVAQYIRKSMKFPKEPNGVIDLFIEGFLAKKRGEHGKALDHYEKLVEIYSGARDFQDYKNPDNQFKIQNNLIAEALVNICKINYDLGSKSKSYNEILPLLERASILGNIEAKMTLGIYYLNQDPVKAFELFSFAADSNFPKAKIYLAKCYLRGIGVEQNQQSAVKLFEELIQYSKNSEAQYELGKCYRNGLGVPQDKIKALELFNDASKKNDKALKELKEMIKLIKGQVNAKNSEAHNILGICYYKGWGVEKDNDKAIELFKVAATGRNINEKKKGVENLKLYFSDKMNASVISLSQDEVKQVQTLLPLTENKEDEKNEKVEEKKEDKDIVPINVKIPEESKEEQEIAEFRELQSLVESGDVGAINNLGICYYLGSGVEQNYQEALRLFTQAANLGNKEAKFNRAKFYLEGFVEGESNETIEREIAEAKAKADVKAREEAEEEKKSQN